MKFIRLLDAYSDAHHIEVSTIDRIYDERTPDENVKSIVQISNGLFSDNIYMAECADLVRQMIDRQL